MKILITGANGFVGYYLVEKLLNNKFSIIATGKGACRLPFLNNDLFTYTTLDFTSIVETHNAISKYQPDIVIHAGAMGKPDECEEKKEEAYLVNVVGTKNILDAARTIKAFVIFISTDFVFPGTKHKYTEDDERSPVNYYGETKMLAEDLVSDYEFDAAIVRTILVYGKPLSGRGNILTVAREKLENGEVYNVFNDQIRTPTYVEDLVSGIASIIQKRKTGIYHIGGVDILSPYQMACKVAEYLKLNASFLKPVSRDTFSQSALRPLCTDFDISKAQKELGFVPTSFEEGLRKTFAFD